MLLAAGQRCTNGPWRTSGMGGRLGVTQRELAAVKGLLCTRFCCSVVPVSSAGLYESSIHSLFVSPQHLKLKNSFHRTNTVPSSAQIEQEGQDCNCSQPTGCVIKTKAD